jgi:hypothetical protein
MNKDKFLGFIITAFNRLIVNEIAGKASAIATEDYLQQRAQRADKQVFRYLLCKIPNCESVSVDEL